MAIEVFWISGSPFAWRVLLTLELKGQPYESRLIERSRGDHRQPAFLAMNPRGRVPVLREDALVIHESTAIMAYLDRRFPDPPLFGRDAAETGLIWQWVAEQSTDVDPHVEQYILPLYFNQVSERAETMRAAIPAIKEHLVRVEATLTRVPWLVGHSLSAADVALYPTIKSLERAGTKPGAAELDLCVRPLSQRYPAIARWTEAMERIPGYDRTFPPHWRHQGVVTTVSV
jgi:glutathione S-transferase